MRAILTVNLDFDSNDPEEIDSVLRELDYHFKVHSESKVKMTDHEIVHWEIDPE